MSVATGTRQSSFKKLKYNLCSVVFPVRTNVLFHLHLLIYKFILLLLKETRIFSNIQISTVTHKIIIIVM